MGDLGRKLASSTDETGSEEPAAEEPAAEEPAADSTDTE